MPEAIGAALIAIAWLSFVGCLVWLVRRAKRSGKRVRAIGMAMMLFGWGHMRDPRDDTVAEAQDGRVRKGTDSGDPE